jgi:hypothetical protein
VGDSRSFSGGFAPVEWWFRTGVPAGIQRPEASILARVTVIWDDEVDDVIGGDAAVGFASVTPARGVVIMPMAPLGLRDRDAGTITITTSLGLPKKLVRLRQNSSVALAYHAREHGKSSSRYTSSPRAPRPSTANLTEPGWSRSPRSGSASSALGTPGSSAG